LKKNGNKPNKYAVEVSKYSSMKSV
jgi:hypothetical protein